MSSADVQLTRANDAKLNSPGGGRSRSPARRQGSTTAAWASVPRPGHCGRRGSGRGMLGRSRARRSGRWNATSLIAQGAQARAPVSAAAIAAASAETCAAAPIPQQPSLRQRQAAVRFFTIARDSTTPYGIGLVDHGRLSDFVSPLVQALYDGRMRSISCENCLASSLAGIIAMHMPISHPLVGCRVPSSAQRVAYCA